MLITLKPTALLAMFKVPSLAGAATLLAVFAVIALETLRRNRGRLHQAVS